jgi:hypothetical protein
LSQGDINPRLDLPLGLYSIHLYRMHGGAQGSGGPNGPRNGNYKHYLVCDTVLAWLFYSRTLATLKGSKRYVSGGTMIMRTRSTVLMAFGLFTVSSGLAWPQQSAPPQSPPERHDPATSGAGPTSGAPGLHPNDPPKGGSITIDSSGVATVKPTQKPARTDAPLDRGNESAGVAPGK